MILVWAAGGLLVYTYLGYPALLRLLVLRSWHRPPTGSWEWPALSVSLPVYNGEASVAAALDALLASPYPAERQILVVSDGSTDATEEVVRRYADRGVELLALPVRVGKTAAENAAVDLLRGEVVLNTDASVRVHPGATMALVAALADPGIGVASSRDVSVGEGGGEGEVAYVGYEMQLRQLETATGGIVGASGSLYAIRASLHRRRLEPWLSRDFSAALYAREQGYRAVSVPGAVCFVPRGRAGHDEYRRKVRTMARGLATLWHHRRLLDPFRYGTFAWKLISHKLCRWCTPFALVVLAAALADPRIGGAWGPALVGLLIATVLLGWWWPTKRAPRWLLLPAYAASAVVAGLHAWWRAFTREAIPMWEPTRRPVTRLPDGPA